MSDDRNHSTSERDEIDDEELGSAKKARLSRSVEEIGGLKAVSDAETAKFTDDDLLEKDFDEELCEFNEKHFSSFGVNLFKTAAVNHPNQNIIFSPISISLALAIVYEGAQGKARKEIESVTGFFSDGELVRKRRLALLERLLSSLNMKDFDEREQSLWTELRTANRLYYRAEQPLKFDFTTVLKTVYQADCVPINDDGKSCSEETMQSINKWIEEKTEGRISNIVDESTTADWSSMLLINAVYFSGRWSHEFDDEITEAKIFYLLDGSEEEIDFMKEDDSTGWYHYFEDERAQVLRLAYYSRKQFMFVLLPKEKGAEALRGFEASLSAEYLAHLMAEVKDYSPGKLIIEMPKFKTEMNFDLKNVFHEIGLKSILGTERNSAQDGVLQLDDIKHKAFIQIDEEGTVAAAATLGIYGMSCRIIEPPPPIEFIANRPFIFAIRDAFSQSLLFLGRFAVPD